MNLVDLWAAFAASAAAGAISIRANMLKPSGRSWTSAPAPVWIGLVALAIAMGMTAASLWTGAHASPREAMVYSLLAAVSGVMLWNLDRNGRCEAARHQQLVRDVETLMRASGPPAHYPWEGGR